MFKVHQPSVTRPKFAFRLAPSPPFRPPRARVSMQRAETRIQCKCHLRRVTHGVNMAHGKGSWLLLSAVFLLLCVASGAPSNWPQFGHDSSHSGRSPSCSGPRSEPAVLWKATTGDWVTSSPALTADGAVIVGACRRRSRAQRVRSLSASALHSHSLLPAHRIPRRQPARVRGGDWRAALEQLAGAGGLHRVWPRNQCCG